MDFGIMPGCTALVTGGSRGIGRAVALRLAENRAARVIINYVQNDAAADETRRQVEAHGCQCLTVRANLGSPEAIDELATIVQSSAGKLDYLVHCAAITAFKPLRDIKPNQWDLTMNVNARSLVLLAGRLAPLMQGGAIVAISSLGSTRVLSNYGAMGVTKGALESVVRYLAVELAGEQIRVNGVTGGLIQTESIMKFPNAEALHDEALRRTPAGRHGTPDDIADAVLFLLGTGARWIYGQMIVVDGGLMLR